MSKQFWAVIVGIVIVLVGIFLLTGDKADKNSNTSNSSNSKAATNHVMGEGSTGVKLIEYGDYQCPYCAAYYPTVEAVVEEYKDKITFQFIHFPLPNLHQNAFAAARAAEAAGMQGKFWEMHDQLYSNADPNGASGWVASNAPTTFFNQFAKNIGLDVTKFQEDSNSSAANNAVNADMTKGNKAEVEATPTFILDGKKVTIENTPEAFRKALDEAIKKKSEN